MDINDKRISHLRRLGESSKKAIEGIINELKCGSDFLEFAEITDSHLYRDGGLLNKKMVRVAGVSGYKKACSEGDLRDEVYSLIYLEGGAMIKRDGVWRYEGWTPHANGLKHLVDYRALEIVTK
ncbi:hypothetical protein J4226_05875 [Candidatus Pacearchaeota archaeon]|nr:hypothetical protein [Candidatus Pacearchaeota archaeon]